MPVAASVSGTMTRSAIAPSVAGGSLSAYNSAPTGYAAGTLEADRTKFLAFYARVRSTRPDVAVEGELLTTLVDQVVLDERLEDPTRFASFTVSDHRAAFFDVATIAAGDRAVTVDLWAGPPGGVKSWRAFQGTTESNQNSLPYRPRGTFRAASNATQWAQKGCVRLEAFSGKTRGEILAAFAANAGVTIANLADLGGGIVRKPVDIAGETVVDLIKRFGEVEGWYPRETEDGTGLEVLNEDRFLDGSPIFALDESNYFDVSETAPSRPVTNWVLSTTRIKDATAGIDGGDVVTGIDASGSDQALTGERTEVAGVDSAGRPTLVVTEVTKNQGAEVLRVVTSWATLATPGVTTGPEVYQIHERTTTRQDWEPFLFYDAPGSAPRWRPSTQLNARHTMKEALAGVPCATGGGYVWATGGEYTTPSAALLIVETKEEAFTWADCFLLASSSVRRAYYAPLVASGYAYPDGSQRSTTTYLFLDVEDTATTWTDLRNSGTPRVEARISVSTFGGLPETFGPSRFVTKIFQGNGSNTSYAVAESTTYADGTSASSSSDSISGAVPGPPTGSPDVPLFEQEVILLDFDATGASGYTKRAESPGAIDFTESMDELRMIATRRIRRACSLELAVTHNAIPFLRVGDHVSITNKARNLSAKSAYVWAISRTAAPLNGSMRQVTTLRVPPDWI